MKKSNLYLMGALLIGVILWAYVALSLRPQDIKTPENHPNFETLKTEADGGYWGACIRLAKYYETYDLNDEAFKYWGCGLKKIKSGKSAAAWHLAGHYFHGIGVEADAEKAAMYLILGDGYNWSHKQNNKWQTLFYPYYDIIDIPDIEQKFKAGAELAKKHVELHELHENLIDNRLSSQLKAIKSAKEGTWFNKGFYILFIMLSFALVMQWLKRKKKIH